MGKKGSGSSQEMEDVRERQTKRREGQEDEMNGDLSDYDPSSNGPIQNRSCTDIICCIIFIIFFLGMIGVAVLAFIRGDPTRLLYPTDSQGNLCGFGDFEDRPNLFFFDMVDCARNGINVIAVGCPTPQVCVKTCPSEYFVWLTAEIQGVDAIRDKLICKYGVDTSQVDKDELRQLIEDEDCAAYYIKSSPVAGRCIPSIFAKLANQTSGLLSGNGQGIVNKLNQTVSGSNLAEGSRTLALFLSAKEYGVQVYQDVRAAWWLILIGLGLAMILSFFFIILMRWIAGPVVFFTIFAFLALFAFATYYCIARYIDMKDNPAHNFNGTVQFTTNLSYYTNLAKTWLIFGCIAGVILLIVILILIFLRSRILIAIQLIKVASKAVGSMISTLFFPLIPFVLEVILFGFWGASAIYLASSGTPTYGTFSKNTSDSLSGKITETINDITAKLPCNRTTSSSMSSLNGFCNFIAYGGDEYTIYLQFYQLFMFFWCMNFIIALGQMTLAGAFASYYWAWKKPDDIPTLPVAASMGRALRYHLGTLAFGSLIIAIVQIIRVFLEYLDHKLKSSENRVAKFVLKCLKCCFWCLEKFLKFLNKNAYILTAVYGTNFCTSAKNAFKLILKNIVRVAVVTNITSFLLLIAKLAVVGGIGVLTFLSFNGPLSQFFPERVLSEKLTFFGLVINKSHVPFAIICIGSYIVATAFFSVYGMAVNTLFLCFLEDLERHDGSKAKPYYMTKGLMKILGKKNELPKSE